MNTSKVILLSVSAVVLSAFAFNQFYQPAQEPLESKLDSGTSANNPPPSSSQQSKQLSNQVNVQTAKQAPEEAIAVNAPSKQENKTTTQVLISKSSAKARKSEQQSDHQGEYSEARPHGHESHGSAHQQGAPLPPGEPKKATASQQPIN